MNKNVFKNINTETNGRSNNTNIVKNITQAQLNTMSSTSNSNNTNSSSVYFTYISNKIKNKISAPLRVYIIIIIPIIILLCYIVYKYNINNRTALALNDMGYKDKLKLEKLPQCYELDKTMQYKLCDYYISSSFMTPCVRNQHYDYVSIDMISEVIQSGARYIQIPICEYDISLQSIPLVATAQYGQKIITSLNSLDVKSVLNVIRINAFKINKKQINYPLIIHFILNTTNSYTLNILSDNIKETISDIIINPSNYTTMPIFLEKLCNLLGKIILIATPEYRGTKLEQFIIPTNKLFNIYHYSDLSKISSGITDGKTNNVSNGVSPNVLLNNKLSSKQQTKSNIVFKQKIPSIEYVIQNSNSISETILNNNDITNNLANFNKVGMTIIKSHQYNDVISSNFNPGDAIFNGCQIVTMNFQINDINMKHYLDIFKESSFKLKPSTMRFSEQEKPIPNLLSLYQAIIPKNNYILNDIYYKYNNLLIAFESYQLRKTYLTQTENNLKFTTGTQVIRLKTEHLQSEQKSNKIGLSQCFILKKSTVGTGSEDIPIFIESVSYTNNLITLNTNYFNLEQKAKNKKNLIKQSMYFEQSNINDNDILEMVDSDDNSGSSQKSSNVNDILSKDNSLNSIANDNIYRNKLIFIRNMDVDNPMYLAFENKQVKAYPKSPQIDAQNNMSFILHIIPFKIQIKLITIYDGSVKTMSFGDGLNSRGILGILENNTTEGTSYVLEPVEQNTGKNFVYNIDKFYMKNSQTNTYVMYDNNTLFLYDKTTTPNTNCIFNLVMLNGYYTLVNNKGYNLIFYDDKLLKFAKLDDVKTNENLFKIDLEYILLN